jgi:ATP-dependent Clp protease adaptor protein ClpS
VWVKKIKHDPLICIGLEIKLIDMSQKIVVSIQAMTSSPTVAPTRSSQTVKQPYPNYKVIVLNDDFNTFEHVAHCLMQYIPGMTTDLAWELTNQVHYEGQATVWVGPLEQAELYHQQLSREGLTMAPLEKA